jgi:putative tryptophan/tyrosine transport system substrate-binding protein
VEQVHRGLGRRTLEIVHQHDALAVLLQLFHHRLPDLLRPAHLDLGSPYCSGRSRHWVKSKNPAAPAVKREADFDPIAGGYVTDIARPNRNITGVVYRAPELAGKQLELLVQAFPDNNPIAALWEPASVEQFNAAQRTAQSLHVELRSHKVENPPFDFDEAFKGIAQDGSRMLLVLSGPLFAAQRGHIADLAIQYHLPTMFTFRFYVEAGGLMSYGIDTVPIVRRAASFVAKILRGAKPSDLPVEQPTNFEFVLNLKTAKAIGVSVPTSILLRADEVIE